MTGARLWHPWLRINRVLRVILHTHWSVEAWAQVIARAYEGYVAKDRGEVDSLAATRSAYKLY